MDYAKEALRLHYEWKGKLEITPRASVGDKESLSLAYTPGVAQPCLEIQKDVNKSYELTRRWNTVAVVTDGAAPCWAWAISVPRPVCPLWRANACCSRPSAVWTPFPFAYAARMSTRLSTP